VSVGLIPAAGRGARFGAAGYVKELFPLVGRSSLRPVADLALASLARAGAARAVVVIAPEKTEIVRVLAPTLPIAYVVQREPAGLPDAIARARPWLGAEDVLLALPDTIVLPPDALLIVDERRRAAGADLALGVFPVESPRELAPVEHDDGGRVIKIHDKPDYPTPWNSWAIASWSARFTDFCAAWDAGRQGERVLGHAFDDARAAGMPVLAVPFPKGSFLDIGTPAGLRAALRTLAAEGLLDDHE
jgi:dTDP-glucose pyrophosphorylase